MQIFEQRVMALLQSVSPFDKSTLEVALSEFKQIEFEPQETIFNAGDVVSSVDFLLTGVGRYYYLDIQGQEKNKSLVAAGGAFASIGSCIDGAGSPFFTQALTRCCCARISYATLVSLADRDVHWAKFVRTVYEKLLLKKERREAELLLCDARQRYLNFIEEFGEIHQQVPLKHVASYLGITDVSLSRIRKSLNLT